MRPGVARERMATSSAEAQALARALSFESSLRSRTEGLTWAIWGVLLALVLLMYAAMGDLGAAPPWWTYALWVPWVGAGAALTWALWRTAALSVGAAERGPSGAVVAVSWALAIAAGTAVLGLSSRMPNPESSGVVAMSVAWLIAGATNLFRATPLGRRVVVFIGAALGLAGLALSFAFPAPSHAASGDAARFAQDVLRAALAAGVPLVAGLWQAMRG